MTDSIKYSINEETMPDRRVAYFRRVGEYGSENNALMEKLKALAKGEGKFTEDCVLLGIAWDDAAKVAPQQCRYDVCMAVSADYKSPDSELLYGRLQGGKYAVICVPHTAEGMQYAWTFCLGAVLKQYHADLGRPIIERYIKRTVDAGLCELCVPIV